jgi:nucleotide-binding universal stress UspA family protein
MYQKMLVLLDGSKLAEVVFNYAQELSARLNIKVELLHVCTPQETDQLEMRQVYMEHVAEKLSCKAAEMRSRIGDKSPTSEVKAHVKVLVGYPAEEILKYADNNNIDLIMLSSHGQSGIRVWDIGNVANKVIHASKVDILMVPTELKEDVLYDRLPIRTIIIPMDGTKLSEAVIPHAISLARQRGAESEMVLLHVDDPTRQQSEITDKEKYFADLVKRIGEEGIKSSVKLLRGHPAETIVNYIENNPAHLIVMSTHAHKGLTTMVFSSVLENVLHMVKKSPILVVKPVE